MNWKRFRNIWSLAIGLLFASSIAIATTGTITVLDSTGATQTYNVLVDGSGHFWGMNALVDGLGNGNPAQVDSSNRLSVAVNNNVALSPTSPDVCTSIIPINQTASTDLKTSVAKLHICSILIVSATAQNVSLVEGTGTTCATGISALLGGTTASMALAANGGFSQTTWRPFLVTKTTADHLCLLQSGAGNVSGEITYVDQ